MLNSRLLLSFLTAFLFSFSNLIFSQNNAWQFDGSTGEAQSAAAVQAVNFNRFTLETWVKMADSPADPTDAFAGVGSLSQPLIWLWFDRTGVQFAPNSLVVGFFDGTAAVNFSHVFDFQPNVWTHVAASFNGNASPKTLDLYLDGVLAASFAPPTNPANWSDERAFLGKIPGTTLPGNHLDGSLDEVRIWRVNRTAAQISASKNTELVGTETNLWNYYKFSAGDCSERDCAGENLFLKKSGGVVAAAGPALTLDATCPPSGCAAPMSGVYTVGGASPDFSTIQLAINALQSRGAADSVFFHLRPVLHNQPILGKSFFGFSQNTPAIFKKEPGTSGTATVYAPTALLLRKTDNYHFENLKFSQLVKLDTCQRTSFRHCTFLNGTMAMQVGTLVDTFLIENCVFDGGSGGGAFGLEFSAYGGVNRKVGIVGNKFLRHYIYSLHSVSEQEDLLIDRNYFKTYGSDDEYVPLSVSNARRKIYITNNHINVKAAIYGVELSNCNTQTTRCLVANNFIRIDSICQHGLVAVSCERFDFYHNTVWLAEGFSPFVLESALPTGRVRNNIFKIEDGNYNYETYPDYLNASDNNLFSSPNIEFNPNAYDLAEWQDIYGFDENSLLLDPQFNTDSIPAPQNPLVNNLGATVAGIPEILTDILGNTRTSPPDAGAREFTPPPPVPMCGAYKIGGTSPDFATPTDAVNALLYNGMACPVTFDLRADTFFSSISIQNIPKNNPADVLLFRRDPATTGEVLWQSTWLEPFSVKIEGTPNVHFANLNFEKQSGTTIDFRAAGGSLKNCQFFGQANPSNNFAVAANALADSLRIDSCRFVGSVHGISLASAAGDFLTFVKIENCTFTLLESWAVKTDGALPDFVFQKNELVGRGLTMAAAGASNPKILSNRFATPNGSAISIQNLAPAVGQNALIGNNFFSVKPTATAPGLNFLNCQKIDFFHNSVSSLPASSGTAVVLTGSQNRLKNNIFSSKHARPVLSASATALVESDYNDLHTTGATLAIFGSTNCANLAAWQTTSGQDLHSISANPQFFSDAKLIPNAAAADGAGLFLTPAVPELSADFYGVLRSDPPDLGAVQFVANSFSALCGEFFVGGVAADFLDFADVQGVLNERGISCNTLFKVQNDAPAAALTLQNITKTHPTDTIRFRAVQKHQGVFLNPVVVKNMSDVFFENMQFKSSATVENAYRTTFDSCHFLMPTNLTSLRVLGDSDSLRVSGCFFQGYVYGSNDCIWVSGGVASNPLTGILIEKSVFEAFSNNVLIRLNDHFKDLKIERNSFELIYGGNGVLVSGAAGNFSIDKNQFSRSSTSYGKGISINDFVGSAAARSVISNNYTASSVVAFSIFNTSFVDIFHNTIRGTGTSGTVCFSSTGNSSKNRFFNNIVANTSVGRLLELSNVAAFDSMNYNNFYTSGAVLGSLGNLNIFNLAAWQTATGFEANSIFAHPKLVSFANPAPQNYQLDGAGLAFAGIPELEHDLRDSLRSSPPTLGAMDVSIEVDTLCGTYHIGGAMHDFPNFTAAVNALYLNRVGCDIEFLVHPATYTESVTLAHVDKIDPDARISFRWDSVAVGGSQPIFAGTFAVQNMSNVSFEGLKFNASGTLNWLNVQHGAAKKCRFEAASSGVLMAGNCDFFKIDSCQFAGTSARVEVASNGFNSLRHGLLRGCTFSGAIENSFVKILGNADSCRIEKNLLQKTGGGDAPAMFLLSTSGQLMILHNRISTSMTAAKAVSWNTNNSTAGKKALVANNFFSSNSQEAVALAACSNLRFLQNTCRSGSNLPSHFVFSTNLGSGLELRNNIFYATSEARAFNGSTNDSDYNLYFSFGTKLLVFNGLPQSNLSAMQAAGQDLHSVFANPMIAVLNNLPFPKNAAANSAGIALAGAPEAAIDLAGQPHTLPPDLGAVSFVPVDNQLCGTFTVGGASPNYATLAAAMADLHNLGVKCDVVFHLRQGTFSENLMLDRVPKTAENLKITFRPDPANTDTVVILGNALTLNIRNTTNLVFERIGFKATPTTSWNNVVDVWNGRNVRFSKCSFVPKSSFAHGLFAGGNFDSLVVKDCRFAAGDRGLALDATNESGQGVRIENSIFENLSRPIYSAGQMPGLLVQSNKIISTLNTGSQWGIEILAQNGDCKILNNRIEMAGGTGISLNNEFLYNPFGSVLIANNFVKIGDKSVIGLKIYDPQKNLKVLFNTIRIDNNTASLTEKAVEISPINSSYFIQNNIFACFGAGPAAYYWGVANNATINRNDYFSQGTPLIYRDYSSYANLAAWQTASGHDAQSKSVNPQFAAADSPTPTNLELAGAGASVSGIPETQTDFFNLPRLSPPDIGAVEFGGAVNDLAASKILSPASGCLGTAAQAVQVRVKNLGNVAETSFQVALQINGGTPTIQNFTAAAIAPGDSATFSFSQNFNFLTAGNFNLKAWTIRAGDAQPANDTTSKTVEVFALPTLAATANMPATCPAAADGSLEFSATGGTAPFTFSLGGVGQAAGFFQNLAVGNYTCTVSDAHGCTKTASAAIANGDTQPPAIANCPSNQTTVLPCPTGVAQVSWTLPTASDNCSVASFSSNFQSGQNFPIGTTTVVYSAVDVSGLTSTCSFSVSVSASADVQPPVISNCPASQSLVLPCGSNGQMVSWVAPAASDNCSAAALTSNFSSNSFFQLGTTVVVYTASDAAGNSATCSFSITLQPVEQVCVWLGGTGDFSNPAKWSCGAVPGWCDSAVVNSGTVNVDGYFGLGSLKLAGGKLVSPAGSLDSIFVEKYFDWSGGTVEVGLILVGTSHLHGGNLNLKKGFLNEGVVNFSSGSLVFGGSVEVLNFGDFVVSGTATGFANQLSGNRFFSKGFVDFQKTGGDFALGVPMENDNVVHLAPNFELKISRNFLGYSHSNLHFKNGSKISILGGTSQFYFFANFTAAAGAGAHVVVNGGAAVLSTDENFFSQNSKIEVLKGRWTASDPYPIGTLRLAGGTVEGNGNLQTQWFDWSGGALRRHLTMGGAGGRFAGGTGTLTKTLTHNGQKFDLLSGNISVGPLGKIVNNSFFRHHSPTSSLLISGNLLNQIFENHGVMLKDTTAAGAVARFNVPFVNFADGEFHGIGSVQFFGGLTQAGLLAPGLDTTAGTLTLTRDFNNQNGTLQLTMFGGGGSPSHDKLVGQRNVELGGTLVIEELGDLPDSTFEIISCGTPTGPTCRFGTFSSAVLPPDFSLIYENKRVLLVKQMLRPAAEPRSQKLAATCTATVAPNPFSDAANLELDLSAAGEVRIEVLDAAGRVVEILLEKTALAAGRHQFLWQPTGGSTGVFFVKIFGKDFCETLRLVRI